MVLALYVSASSQLCSVTYAGVVLHEHTKDPNCNTGGGGAAHKSYCTYHTSTILVWHGSLCRILSDVFMECCLFVCRVAMDAFWCSQFASTVISQR
jgi:hypothetical protein